MMIMADEMLRSCERKRLADKCHCSKVESKVINVFRFLATILIVCSFFSSFTTLFLTLKCVF